MFNFSKKTTSLLQSLENKINPCLKSKLLIGTHHKSGTAWMSNIFTSIANQLNLNMVKSTARKAELFDYNLNFDILVQAHSRFDLTYVERFKGLHIIRDPRDLIVSASFYHMKSSEEWLHIKRKKFGYITYQERINSFSSLDDQLLFEMEHASVNNIEDIMDWNYKNHNFIEIKYENLIEDFDMKLFQKIFYFLDFREKYIPKLLNIAYENSLFSGKVKNSVHVRSGKKNQWTKFFKKVHCDRFIELFGDSLVKLGYEDSN